MTMGVPQTEARSVALSQPPTLAWVLKRTLLAVAIMFVVVGGAAWLLDASIDRSAEQTARPSKSISATETGSL